MTSLKTTLEQHKLWVDGKGGERANLSGANFSGADLRDADLSRADLSGANFSGATGLKTAREFMRAFGCDKEGVLVFKAIGKTDYSAPSHWKIESDAFLEEVVNPLPTCACGCGVNFGTEDYCRKSYPGSALWLCRIHWLDLADVVVPYNSEGKARCARLQLLKVI